MTVARQAALKSTPARILSNWASFKHGYVLVFALCDAADGLAGLDSGTNGLCTGLEATPAINRQYPDATDTDCILKVGDLDTTEERVNGESH
jgi:hypothetical protein